MTDMTASNASSVEGDLDGGGRRERESSTSSLRSFLSPSFYSPVRTGSITSAVFNLITSMVGGGVLSLPYAFSRSGLLVGAVIVVVMGCISGFTVSCLVSCSRRSGRTTFEDVIESAMGRKGRAFAIFCIILVPLLGTIGYAVLLRDLLHPVYDRFFGKPGEETSNVIMIGEGGANNSLLLANLHPGGGG